MATDVKNPPIEMEEGIATEVHVDLPSIPLEQRYFSISEVSKLCELKPHVLRYWEQEFKQLKPTKGTNKQRYYKKEDIVLVRQIKRLLYKEGYTIEGARTKLSGSLRQRAQSRAFIKPIITELKAVLKLLEAV